MRILYFDCFSGISGDMTVSAFLDLGLPELTGGFLLSQLETLRLDGWRVEIRRTEKHGIGAAAFDVITDHDGHHHGRHLSEICGMIDSSGISGSAKQIAKRIFERLARAEARVHGSTPEEVHFHEVGAVDSIIDIVSAAVCVDAVKPDVIASSLISDGSGFTVCAHGTIPVPVPAVMEIFRERNVPLRQIDIQKELVTPTGAAIIAELSSSFGAIPTMKITKTGYGAGKRDNAIPNVLRLLIGEAEENQNDEIVVLETNIDDSTPEILGYVMEELFANGAKDVFYTPIHMKKSRPAHMLTVLCETVAEQAMHDIIFNETGTLGIRRRVESRVCLQREMVEIETEFGMLQAKKSVRNGKIKLAAEYEDAKRLARDKNVPLYEIINNVSTKQLNSMDGKESI